MVRQEVDADELQYVGRPPRVLPLGLRWRLLISNYAMFFGSIFFAGAVFIALPLIAGIVWAIWNERMIVLIVPLLLVLTFPLVGLASAIEGVRDGLRKIHLLRQGELGRGTIVTCRFNKSALPFVEFLRQWQELPVPQPLYFRTLVRVFFTVWNSVLIASMILGGIGAFIVCRGIARGGELAFRNGPRLTGPTAVLTTLGMLVAWWALGLFLWSRGRRVRSVLSGQVSPARLNPHPELRCTFEYRLPGGEIIRAEDTVTFSTPLGDEPTQPVLYDPARPDRAILLHGLCPRVRVAPAGAWEAGEGPGALRRTILLALCWLGSPLMSGIFWSIFLPFQHKP